MSNEFQAQRAILNNELTAIAMAGGDTSKTRAKLEQLDAREQAAQEAQAAAREAERKDRLIAATESAERRCDEIIDQAIAAGHAVSPADAQQLAHLCHTVAEIDAELSIVSDARRAASEQASLISGRIKILEDRRAALSGLRLSGQSNDRDLLELGAIGLDLATLNSALVDAQARLDAIVDPEGASQRRRQANEEISALQREIVTRSIAEQIAAQERELLASIRRLVEASGARHATGVYRRTPELDFFIRTGVLK